MTAPTPYGPLSYEGLTPSSCAWRESDPVGDRLCCELGEFTTQSGFTFPQVQVA